MHKPMQKHPIFQKEWELLDVLQSLQEDGPITKRDLLVRVRGRNAFKTAQSLEEPLNVLEECGYIRTRKTTNGKGRPSVVIDVLSPDGRDKQKQSPPAHPPVKDAVRIRPPEWSKRTGMSRSETYRLMYSGQLRASQIGKMWFIDATELTAFFERESQP